jgi:hypothetical protein
MAKDDFKEAKGILYAKPIKKGKKKDGSTFEIPQLVLEIDGSYENKEGKWVTNTYLMLFTAGKNVAKELDSFEIKDSIILSYLMTGKQFKRQDGSLGYDNNLYATSIKHADIDRGARKPAKEQPAEVEDNSELDGLPF